MESGSIAKWNLKEGDKFEAGQAICEVETDKATVTYDATDDGYIARILVGTGEVKVGQPLMITVEESSSIEAFKSYCLADTTSSAVESSSAHSTPAPVAAVSASIDTPQVQSIATPTTGSRIVASPYAKKLAKEASIDISLFSGSGPAGRIIAADVLSKNLKQAASLAQPATLAAPKAVIAESPVVAKPAAVHAVPSNFVYQDFTVTDMHLAVAQRLTHAKTVVPHYYLSVDINVDKLIKLQADLNGKDSLKTPISVQDLLIKAAAVAMKQVPDVNASWMETFVRRYHQVDINVVMGSGAGLVAPVIRDVGSKGLGSIASEVSKFEESFLSASPTEDITQHSSLATGTFTVHNLGMFGVKAAAPIVLPPQACALALGTIIDTVIPAVSAGEIEAAWTIAPVLTATMSCDHRVVDGAVGAQYLQAFKATVENPISMLL